MQLTNERTWMGIAIAAIMLFRISGSSGTTVGTPTSNEIKIDVLTEQLSATPNYDNSFYDARAGVVKDYSRFQLKFVLLSQGSVHHILVPGDETPASFNCQSPGVPRCAITFFLEKKKLRYVSPGVPSPTIVVFYQ